MECLLMMLVSQYLRTQIGNGAGQWIMYKMAWQWNLSSGELGIHQNGLIFLKLLIQTHCIYLVKIFTYCNIRVRLSWRVTWSFDLLMSEFRNVSLSSHGDDLLLDPDSNNGIPVTIRNSGNVENLFTLDLQIIDGDGNVIDDIPISDRIEYNGWTVAIFGGYERRTLMPTNSRTFRGWFSITKY